MSKENLNKGEMHLVCAPDAPAAGLERLNKSRGRDFAIYHTRIESRNAGMVNLIPFIVEHNAQGEGLQAAPDLC